MELLDSEGDLASPRPMDAMRGTNFIAGRRWLREHGHESRYLEGMKPEVRAVVEAAQASTWIPVSIALPHYAALDGLELSFDQRVEFGAAVSRHINGVVLGTIARLAGSVGLSPFTPLSRAATLFARNFRGGAVASYRVSSTEARFDVLGVPFAVSTCHRDNVLGALLDGARPFASSVQVTELGARRTSTSYAFRLKW